MTTSFVGRTLGKYEIVDTLGHGGMATVYKGYQRDVERYVAVKVLPPHPGQDASFVERFEREARTIARLQHPHIVPLYDYGEQDGVLYIISAFIDDGTLRERMARGALPLDQIERIFTQIAGALDYAHRQGVVHRDVKPENMLLDREGFARLADFGIVKIALGGESNLTGTGGLIGTPAYMSPEQINGMKVDGRSDIYALAIVLYELLAGVTPFDAETPLKIVVRQVNDPPPPLSDHRPDLPAAVTTVLTRALAKDPDARYQTAADFAADFQRALRGDALNDPGAATIAHGNAPTLVFDTPPPGQLTPPPPGPTTPQVTIIRERGSNPLVLLGGFLIIAVLLIVVVALISGASPDAEPISTAAVQVNTPAATPRPTTPALPSFGTVTFATSSGLGDTINIAVSGLARPGADQLYAVHLHSAADDEPLLLGALRLDAFGNGLLQFTDPDGRTLPTLYNMLTITQTTALDAADGTIVYSGSVPLEVTGALREILIESLAGSGATADRPGRSLLATAIQEAEIGERHAGLAADSRTVVSMVSHVEHTINIFNGTEIDYNGNGRAENPGRSIGVVPMLDAIEAALDQAFAAASSPVQTELELIRVCVLNTRERTEQLLEREALMLEAESIEAVAQERVEATLLALAIMDGDDLNGNGNIEAFEGECGLRQIPEYAIAAGWMMIVEGALPDAG